MGFGQPTLYLEWAGDFKVNQRGGLELATGWTQVSQRIIRRLLTNPRFRLLDGEIVPAGYIYHTDFGAGMRRRVGEAYTEDAQQKIKQAVYDGVMIDEDVDNNIPPVVNFAEITPHYFKLDIGITLKTKETGVIVLGYRQDDSI